MNRNTVLVVVVAIAGIFLFLNPLQYFRGGPARVVRPAADPAVMDSLRSFAEAHWRSPEDYVLGTFATHDIVFLGEFFKIRQNVQLVSALIPRLYAAGVRCLGIEYALSDDQGDIDALLSAPGWDEAKARAITFDWLETWGFQEYVDLYKTAWQLNHGLPAGAPPFRIVGLNVRQDWAALRTDRDMNDPKVVAKIFAAGLPDAHMAAVIDSQIIQKGEKALIFCGRQHIFTRFHSRDYEKYVTDMHLSETRLAAAIVYDRIGTRAFSICLHAPWPDKSQKTGLAYPAEGVIDALITQLPPEKRNAGFDTSGTPLGGLPVKTGVYAKGAPGLTVSDLFDGYVIQGPIADYTMVTPIRDFVQPRDADRAGKNFPGIKPTLPTPEQVNQSIVDEIKTLQNVLAQFK
jgi:hypothetical protein